MKGSFFRNIVRRDFAVCAYTCTYMLYHLVFKNSLSGTITSSILSFFTCACTCMYAIRIVMFTWDTCFHYTRRTDPLEILTFCLMHVDVHVNLMCMSLYVLNRQNW